MMSKISAVSALLLLLLTSLVSPPQALATSEREEPSREAEVALLRDKVRLWYYYFAETPSEKEARSYIQYAQDASDGEASFLASELVGRRGMSPLKDREVEKRLLMKAVEEENEAAVAHLGVKRLVGLAPFEQDVDEGQRLLTEAAEFEHPEALLHVGLVHLNGWDPYERDIGEAKRVLSLALTRGNLRAHFFLGVLAAHEGNHEEAERHLQIGARAGDPQAMDGLAALLWKREAQHEKAQALEWAAKAARSGRAVHQYSFALMLVELHKEDLPSEINDLLADAARGGSTDAVYLRGALHLNGQFATSDRNLGERLIREAAASGHEEATRAVAQMDRSK